MRRLVLLSAVALIAAAAAIPLAHAAPKKLHVLVQWPEGDSLGQWAMTKHVGGLLNDVGPDNIQLEVVAYGRAATAVTTRPVVHIAEDIAKFQKEGVVFHVCRHAMEGLGVKDSELLPGVTPVKGAMWYTTQKFGEGWQILRP